MLSDSKGLANQDTKYFITFCNRRRHGTLHRRICPSIPIDRLDEYKRVVKAGAEIWKEHGALDYQKYVGDDSRLEGTRSFTNAVGATKAIVFGWVVDSRVARDVDNEKVAADPRMVDLIDSSNTGYDAKRMAYGGFRSFVRFSHADAV